MGNGFRNSVIAAVIGAASLSACEKKDPTRAEPSSEVVATTHALNHLINDTLQKERYSIEQKALSLMPEGSLCVISTHTETGGLTESIIYCESPKARQEGKGIVGGAGPIQMRTTLDPQIGFTTFGVHLNKGLLVPTTGCGIQENGYTNELTGSYMEECKETNIHAVELVNRYERLIDLFMQKARETRKEF